MPEIKTYIVTQVRTVRVTVAPMPEEGVTYEQAALTKAEAAFNLGTEPTQPKIISTTIERN